MLTPIKNRFYVIYRRLISSIAFYPSIISLCFVVFAILILSLDNHDVIQLLKEHAAPLMINNADTARTILATLVGGIISLTVFSFSMVMILLNQASSNFSPRLLPGLISDRGNQTVLGVYIGTILYNIIVMISIRPSDGSQMKSLSILFGIIFGVICLGMFVMFIHGISTGIQINNILDKIYHKTKERIQKLISEEREEVDDQSSFEPTTVINSGRSGYYEGVNLEGLKAYAKEHKIRIKVCAHKGKYLLPDMPIMTSDTELDTEQQDLLRGYIIYGNNQEIADNFVLGVKEITEVGVKAMSPGINDPGTALITIDYLTDIFSMRMEIDDTEVHHDEEHDWSVELEVVDFSTLIYQTLAAYRQYCKHDIIVMEKLILMLQYLKGKSKSYEQYRNTIEEQLQILREDYKANIQNAADVKRLERLYDRDVSRE